MTRSMVNLFPLILPYSLLRICYFLCEFATPAWLLYILVTNSDSDSRPDSYIAETVLIAQNHTEILIQIRIISVPIYLVLIC